MLKDIYYSGYELREASFSLLNEIDGSGSFKAEFELCDETGFHNFFDEDETHVKNILDLSVQSIVTGTSPKSDDAVFETKIKVKLNFEMSKDINLEQKFVEENEWFFLNFAHIALKEVLDDIMRHTSFQGVKLPTIRLESSEL